ncbi:MAG: non-ribosomal peptide synthetase [Gammaproteobacteria bacterium]|nr:non-ribosomal peptide synthetase [Gammaproteobacteria bacterium]
MIEFTTLNEALESVRNSDRSITFIEGKFDNRLLTYSQLHLHALKLLFDLQQAGLGAGDQMILFTKNNQKFIEAFWACILGGIIPVPVAVGISDEHRAKLMRIFNKLEKPFLFTEQEHLERLFKYADTNDMHESIEMVKQKSILADKLPEHDNQGTAHNTAPQDTAFIQFSSGSTSEPKGVVLSHENIMINLNSLAIGAEYRPEDISLSWMPLTHDLGLLGFHLNMLLVNISQCLMPTDLFSRRPVLWLEKASELNATVLCSPNFGYKHFLKALGDKTMDGVDLSQVRVIFNGAEPISLPLCAEFLDAMSAYGLQRTAMWTVYGLAEATLAVALPPVAEEYQAVHIDRHRLRLGDEVSFVSADHDNALGFAIEGPAVKDLQIMITDEENNWLASNHIGLVQIRGPSVTQGFYMDEEASSEVLTGNGWLNTGDLGFLTSSDELVITGRHKDIIFSNAQNYFPHDIESVALQLPELELNKVVAYGVRQPDLDTDTLLVFVLFRADLPGFIGIARDVARHINEQMGLEVKHVVPVQRIPKTTSGKLQRRILAEAFLNGEYDESIKQLELIIDASVHQSHSNMSQTEMKLKQVFDSIVQDNPISLDDNFFEIGISSLTLVEINMKIDEVWPDKVDIDDIFTYQTVTELAQFIDS